MLEAYTLQYNIKAVAIREEHNGMLMNVREKRQPERRLFDIRLIDRAK
jgi:hypothetical protein